MRLDYITKVKSTTWNADAVSYTHLTLPTT